MSKLISTNSLSESFEVDWGDNPLIPEGDYQAVYVHHETTNGSFGPKVKIIFRIVSQGQHFETLIPAWYNVKDGSTSKRRDAKIKLARGSRLTSELLRVLQIKKRVDRLSPSMLKGYLLTVKVRTVKTDSRQKKLTEAQHYSVISSLECILNLQDISEVPNVLPKPIPEPIPTIKPAGAGLY
jgi:hypothetical protein